MTTQEFSHASPPDVEVYNDMDAEKYPEKPDPTDAIDPFGNEESGEVKYRVMKWW